MNIRILTAMAVALVGVAFIPGEANAFSCRPGLIPNGTINSCANCHVSPAGGGTRNPFGMLVEPNVDVCEDFWAPFLACPDSDGDGFPNGIELQDPCGLVGGGPTGNTANVSNPGFPNGAVPPTGQGNPTPPSPTQTPCPACITPTPTVTLTPTITPTMSPTPTVTPTASATATPMPFNDAQVFSHNIPAQIPADHPTAITVTMKNTGNIPWTSANNHTLAVITDPCMLAPGNRFAFPPGPVVEPNHTYNFTMTINAPAAGPCQFELRMVQEFVEFFGDTLSLNIDIVPFVNNSQLINNSLVTTMGTDQPQLFSVTVRNLGNTTWMPGNYSLDAVSDPCGMFTTTQFAPDGNINPNTNHAFQLALRTPMVAGPCAFQLQMRDANFGLFGPVFNFQVDVVIPPNAARDWEIFK